MLFADGTEHFKIFMELKKKKSRKCLLTDDLVTPGVNILFHGVKKKNYTSQTPL